MSDEKSLEEKREEAYDHAVEHIQRTIPPGDVGGRMVMAAFMKEAIDHRLEEEEKAEAETETEEQAERKLFVGVMVVDPQSGEIVADTGQVPPEDVERVLQIVESEDEYRLFDWGDHDEIIGVCRNCGRTFDEGGITRELNHMFGSEDQYDGDYIVQTWALCPDCWPEYL